MNHDEKVLLGLLANNEEEILVGMLQKEDTAIWSSGWHADIHTGATDHAAANGGGGVHDDANKRTSKMLQQQSRGLCNVASTTSNRRFCLSQSPVTVVTKTMLPNDSIDDASSSSTGTYQDDQSAANTTMSTILGEYERFEVCKWYYMVVDYYSFDRTIVTTAVSYLDRMLLWKATTTAAAVAGSKGITKEGNSSTTVTNEPFLELLAVASLYLAIKLFDNHYHRHHIHLLLHDFVLMSKGKLSAEEMVEMESQILMALGWNVHTPIPQNFMHHMIKLAHRSFPTVMNKDLIRKITCAANFFLEVIVFDTFLTQEKPSVIACAAISISLEFIHHASATEVIQQTMKATMAKTPLGISCWEAIPRVQARMDAFLTRYGYKQDLLPVLDNARVIFSYDNDNNHTAAH